MDFSHPDSRGGIRATHPSFNHSPHVARVPTLLLGARAARVATSFVATSFIDKHAGRVAPDAMLAMENERVLVSRLQVE